MRHDLHDDIDKYLRQLEKTYNTEKCLERHQITKPLRARMIDWMIEVLTNFRCDDQTFFIAVSLMDRFFKGTPQHLEVSHLHAIGVTAMFLSSKFEDIQPLKMVTVYEKIAHQKIEIQKVKSLELEILKVCDYKLHAPSILDFLKDYLHEALGIEIANRTCTKKK